MPEATESLPAITKKEWTAQFWESLEGRSWFPLHFPAPGSPLTWRDCLVFSAIAYRRRLGPTKKITYVGIADRTSQDREKVASICKKLADLGLLDEELRVTEPDAPEVLFALKRKTPLKRTWLDRLVYSRYYLLAEAAGWEPWDSVLMAALVFRVPQETTVSYLAAITGIDRKQVRSSLGRLCEHGLRTEKVGGKRLISYAGFEPDPGLFRKSRPKGVAAKKAAPIYPAYLSQLEQEGKIPHAYLADLAALTSEVNTHVFPGDWYEVIRACWQEHQSFKAKTNIPYPSPNMIRERIVKRYNNRRACG